MHGLNSIVDFRELTVKYYNLICLKKRGLEWFKWHMLEFFVLCDSGIFQYTVFKSAAGNPNFCLSLSVLKYAFGNN